MIHHVIFRVTSDESDDPVHLLDGMELDDGVDCSITTLPGFLEFDFEVDLSDLPVSTPAAARSTASAYLTRSFTGLNWRIGEAHFEQYPDCDFGWCDHQAAA